MTGCSLSADSPTHYGCNFTALCLLIAVHDQPGTFRDYVEFTCYVLSTCLSLTFVGIIGATGSTTLTLAGTTGTTGSTTLTFVGTIGATGSTTLTLAGTTRATSSTTLTLAGTTRASRYRLDYTDFLRPLPDHVDRYGPDYTTLHEHYRFDVTVFRYHYLNVFVFKHHVFDVVDSVVRLPHDHFHRQLHRLRAPLRLGDRLCGADYEPGCLDARR